MRLKRQGGLVFWVYIARRKPARIVQPMTYAVTLASYGADL